LKYCHPQRAKYLGSVGARFLKTPIGLPSLEAQIAHICNGIAHNTYEIDDGLRAKVISIRQLREYTLFAEHHDAVMKKFPLISQRRAIHEIIRQIINAQVDNLVDTSHEHLEAVQPQNIAEIRDTEDPLITFSATMYEKHLDLKQFLHTQMYQHYRVRRMAFKAQHVIQQLFEAFFSDACLLPLEAQMEVQRLQAALGTELGKTRAIADYIAGMTDRHAIVEHERLFNPQMMPFDKIY
jgi:dGTPase